jgi:serine/threonine-protein kinase
VTLWELVSCGRLFRRSNDAETIMAVVHDPIAPPSQLRPHLPRALDAVVMKALAREPSDRYSSAREMGRDLNRILVAHELSVGNADVAELMQGLFPGGREQAQRMVGEARVAPAGVIRRAPDEPAVSDRLERRGAPIPVVPPPPRRDGRGRFLTLAIGLAGGIALTLAVTLWLGGFGAQSPAPAPAQHASSRVETTERPPEVTRIEPVLIPPPEVEAQEPAPEPVEDEPAPDMRREQAPSERTQRDSEMRATTMQTRPTGPAGTVNVVTPGGWADIYVAGTRRGRTPGRVSLPPGRHVIQLRPFGREAPRNVSVEVPPGGTARVSVRLSR